MWITELFVSFLVLTSSNQSHNNDILIEHPGSFPNLSTNNFNYVSEILSSILDAYNSSGYFPQLYQPSLQDLENLDEYVHINFNLILMLREL